MWIAVSADRIRSRDTNTDAELVRGRLSAKVCNASFKCTLPYTPGFYCRHFNVMSPSRLYRCPTAAMLFWYDRLRGLRETENESLGRGCKDASQPLAESQVPRSD